MRNLLAAVLVLAPLVARADEGMWTFDNFPSDKVKARYGFAPDAAWLERVRLGSARTASCSASFVSPDGLVMTNHHCARDCVEDVSTKGQDFVAAGFLARDFGAELKCPGERVDQLLGITDVSERVAKATQGKTGDAFAAAQRAELGAIEKECMADKTTHCQVVALYRGGLHHLYRYRRWTDVRLVFAPEEAITFFGGDPDNYEYPRWNLDVSFFRIYEDGKPVATPFHLRFSKTGVREGDVIFLSGNPSRTSRLLTVDQLRLQRDLVIPEWGLMLAEQRGFLAEYRRRGPEQARTAAGVLFSIENNFKRALGQHKVLVDPAFMAEREAAEKDLRARVAADGERQKKYGGAWDAIAKANAAYRPYRLAMHFLEDRAELAAPLARTPRGFDAPLFSHARMLVRWSVERKKPSARRLREYQDAGVPDLQRAILSTAPIYPDLEAARLQFALTKMREVLRPEHPVVRKLLVKETPEELAERVVRGTRLADPAVRKQLWEDEKALAAAIATDPMLQLAAQVDAEARAVRARFESEYDAVTKQQGELIARARFEVYGTSLYPDATFTPRLAYGRVAGTEIDGVKVPWTTDLEGLKQRATGRPPFALPPTWIAALSKLPRRMPFNFIGTPDSVGGNSGSPVIDRKGEIVGLYFDQNIQGTAQPFGHEEHRRRGISVHADAILTALDVVYSARQLARELRGR